MITLVNESAANTNEISRKINLLKNRALKTNSVLITVVNVSKATTLSEGVGPLRNLMIPRIIAKKIIKK